MRPADCFRICSVEASDWEPIAWETAAVEVQPAVLKSDLETARADWGCGRSLGARARRSPPGRLGQRLEWLEVDEFPVATDPGSEEPKALGLLGTVALPALAAGPRWCMCKRPELPVADGRAVRGLAEEDSVGSAGFVAAAAAARCILCTGLAGAAAGAVAVARE